MKKLIVIGYCFFSVNMFSLANDTIKVDYHYHLAIEIEDITPAMRELYEEVFSLKSFLGVHGSKITITGNIKDKNFITFTHIVKDGKDSLYSSDTSFFPMWNDTLIISVQSLPVDSNKVKINKNYGNRWSKADVYDIGSNKKCLLIETSLLPNDIPNVCGTDWYLTTLSEVFPIIAYSSGIPLENGWIHICGLRDAGVHPKLWSEKFKIKNYVYFEMKFFD
jgi:hypothetical protein